MILSYIYIYIYIYIYVCIINRYILDVYIYIYIYIYISNSWNIDCDPGFHGVFCKTTIIRQLRICNESKIENTKKYRQKTIEISLMWGCKCLSVCGCVRMRVCVIVTYGCVFL